MAITCTRLTRGTDGSAPFQTASVSPGANKLLLLCVQVYRASGTPATPTVSGNGLTWVQVDSVLFRSDSRIAVFRAMGAAPTSGVITITAASSTLVLWSLHEIDGIDTGGTNGSAAIIQSGTTSAPGASSLTVTLAAFASAASAGFGFGARFSGGGAFTAEVDWSEKDDLNGQTVVFRDGTTDNSVTFTPAVGADDMGGIALELAASSLVLDAANGAMTINGQSAGLTGSMVAGSGSMAVSGQTVDLPAAGAGSLAITGQALASVAEAETGEVAINGQASGGNFPVMPTAFVGAMTTTAIPTTSTRTEACLISR